jgi:hypothetical protein
MTTHYKFLFPNGTTPQGHGVWPLPEGGKPGEWLPKITGDLVACKNGYHVLQAQHLIDWVCGADLYEVEVKGKVAEWGNKNGVRQARAVRKITGWNEQTARLFAADCAEHVLPVYEKSHPSDARPREAITAARAVARGEISAEGLAAAWDAARAAARDARDAARAAAWDARAAAGAAEKEWQTERLLTYFQAEA